MSPPKRWKDRRRSWRRTQSSRLLPRGQAVVEFAIVSIALLLLLATVIDFGRLFYSKITVENAARAGALVAAQTPDSFPAPKQECSPAIATTDRIGCAVQNESHGSLVTIKASEITVTCEDTSTPPVVVACPASPMSDMRSRVSVTTRFGFLMPILTMMVGDRLNISASVVADQEKLPPAATVLPTPTPTATPTPTPTPAGTPTPTPTPVGPCQAGFALVPDLVTGATGPGSTETEAEALTEWQTAGFPAGSFTSQNGFGQKDVAAQYTDSTKSTILTPGVCAPIATTHVYVTHS